MSAAHQFELEPDRDKLTEEEMAARIGTTVRGLQTRRYRKQIPYGVWNKINGDIIYSWRRYEAWLETTWDCPPELSLLVPQSVSASPGKEPSRPAAAKRSASRKPRKGLQLPPAYVLK